MKALEIKQLKKDFGSLQVLKGVTLGVEAGEIFGYLGPNGAGKTTTIRSILDFIRPTSGSVRIFGHDAQGDAISARSEVSYLSSDNNLYKYWTGRQHIDYLASLRPINAERLRKLKTDLNFNDSVKVHQLSTGNKQKLGVILALIPKAKLLILDEPTRGLDPLLQNQFHSTLHYYRDAGGTVFMSSHDLAEVQEVCDRVAIIRAGTIVTNETIETLKDKSLYHVRLVLSRVAPTTAIQSLGAENFSSHGKVVHFKLRGRIDELMKEIAKLPVADVEITRSTLEELFMELYQ